jgi:hypothetical protein
MHCSVGEALTDSFLTPAIMSEFPSTIVQFFDTRVYEELGGVAGFFRIAIHDANRSTRKLPSWPVGARYAVPDRLTRTSRLGAAFFPQRRIQRLQKLSGFRFAVFGDKKLARRKHDRA